MGDRRVGCVGGICNVWACGGTSAALEGYACGRSDVYLARLARVRGTRRS